jgi:hypothetical protein
MPVAEPRLPRPIVPPAPGGNRDPVRTLVPGLAFAVLVLLTAAILTSQPRVAIAVPAAAVGALACARLPTAAVLTVFTLAGATNAIPTLTPIPSSLLADYLLLGLWLGVALVYLSGHAKRSFWLWPPLIASALYLVLTLVQALMVTPVDYGVKAFGAAAWSMAAVLMVAAAPWSAETHRRMARGIVVVAVAVGGYCLLLFLTAPSASETAAARAAQIGLPPSVQERFFGSFLTANELAAWTATVIPFLLAFALAARGRWRALALLAIVPLGIALFDSDVRTGILAVAVGLVVVLALYLATPAFGRRLAAGLAGVAVVGAIGVAGYAITIEDSPERAERFGAILSPGDDKAFSDRRETWDDALAAMSDEPWGYGLGTVGGVTASNGRASVVSDILDSSYLKVGLEQGFLVMVFFIGGLLLLLGGLAVRVTRVSDRQSAMLMISACGALASALVLFYAGLYSEGMPILAAWLIVGLGVSQVTIHGAGALRPAAARP